MEGWVAALTGQTTETQRWADFLDTVSFELTPVDGSASFASAWAMLRAAICPDGPERMLADSSFAVAAEPPGSVWRDTALAMSGEAHLLIGDLERAASMFEESSSLGTEYGNLDNVLLARSELALLAMDRGQWNEAGEHLEVALDIVENHGMHDNISRTLAFAAAARLAVHQATTKRAAGGWQPPCEPARCARRRSRGWPCGPACSWQRSYESIADHTTARHLLREIDEVLRHRPNLGTLVDQVAQFRVLRAPIPQPRGAGAAPLTPAELRLLPYLQTHLTIGEIGERLFVSRNTVSSQVGLDLPQARRLDTQRGRAQCHDGRAARRMNNHLTRACKEDRGHDGQRLLLSQGLFCVVPERQGQLRGRRDDSR